MKKIVLSLAGVMAAVAFAPEASAVPVFARQTGMACSACHFQHFPLLNGFGRAFKSSGFTMMGAQGRVEGEHLDIPDRLNFGILTTMRYENVSGSNNPTRFTLPSFGGETAIFFGGRIAEFAGFLTEIAGAAKLAMLFPVGDYRVGFVTHTSTGQGAAYSFETLNTGAANTHKLSAYSGSATANGGAGNHVNVVSASQYLGTNIAATGAQVVANGSMGFVSLGKWEPVGGSPLTPGAGAPGLSLTYARAVYTMDLAGFDAGFGIQNFGGSTMITPGLIPLTAGQAYHATTIDAQLQGEVAEMPAGFYASYGTAEATTATLNNAFNLGAKTRSSLNLSAELGVIPHIATAQIAFRFGQSGQTTNGLATGSALKDNAIMLGGTYELAQNVELSLTHTMNSGSQWNSVAGVTPAGKTETGLMMEALF